ncbi:hypothetical protein Q7C36_011111 [Tachysurus vachellii]|uniref:G-protein coupled receptors family 1 profile domain-containing protein n=1 Tax=Tachysurus vachellii TaxID=175792 RepID=A0AA88SQP8_TACVA|nr:hypothetical protein Q7C36_011111 [Tachysurus vachellii]
MNLTEFNQSDGCDHFSCPERSVSIAVYILLYMCSAAVVLLTLCGNLLIIISVLHFKQFHTPTNMLLLSLAVSDFLTSCWIFGTSICIFSWVFCSFIMVLSAYNVALISVAQYLALSNPECFLSLNEVWAVIDLIYSFIFPLSVIIILYTRVFVIAKKHATAIRELNNHTRPKTQKITSHSMKSERKAAKVLSILVSVFLLCLLPYFIYSLLGNVIELQTETT